jgi:hypothetical protein
MAIRPGIFASIVLLSAAVHAAPLPPLPDGYLITGIDGEFQQTAPGVYTFMFDKDIKTTKGSITAGHEVELLPSTTLEYMLRDLGSAPHMGLRLWGTVTVYKGRNYIFPSYYLKIAPVIKQTIEPNAPATAEEAAPSMPVPSINEANDEIRIPEQLMRDLQATRRVVDTAPAVSATDPNAIATMPVETGDVVVVGRVGMLMAPDKSGERYFRLDGLGRSVSLIKFHILPCQALEQLQGQIVPTAFNPVRHEVAGVVTKFHGEYYVLPTRVIRSYNYGNFAQ